LKVAHITTEFPPFIDGGLAIAVGELVQELLRKGAMIKILHIQDTGCKRYKGIITEKTHTNRWQNILAHHFLAMDTFQMSYVIETCADFIGRWKPDIVHVHTFNSFPVANAIKDRFGIPIIYTVHTLERNEEYGHMSPLEYLTRCAIQEALINISDRIIVLSNYERELLVEYYPKIVDRIRVVGNGIRCSTDSAIRIRNKHKADSNKINTVLYVGRFISRKGIQDLFEVIPLVLHQLPRTQFLLVGGEPGVTPLELQKKWLPDKLSPYQDQIIFEGWIGEEELQKMYESADVLVVPSRYEPFGLVMLEGMSYGLPVVASSVGGPLDAIEHGRTGFLFQVKDLQAFSYYLIFLLKNPDIRRQVGESALKEVHQKWQWTHIVEKIQDIYQEILFDRNRINDIEVY
jgi:glycogen synthase